jgi:dihydroorotate dehydrogenase electron transfer subunit
MIQPAPLACHERSVWHGPVKITENVAINADTYRVRIRCPKIARVIVPGQFLMFRLPRCEDPLLGRPLAFYEVVTDDDGVPEQIDIVYVAMGRMTKRLAALQAGATLEVWGPLGNGFPLLAAEHVLLVAGGIGQTPFLSLARECLGHAVFGDPPRQATTAKQVTLCYGARSKEHVAGVDDFRRHGVTVHVSTDDGSLGRHGLVTDLIEPAVQASPLKCQIVCCGPEPMMKATAAVAQRLGIRCLVSLETPMACGIGACFSCVAKIRDASGNWDYRRTCVEGPVFDAASVEFD